MLADNGPTAANAHRDMPQHFTARSTNSRRHSTISIFQGRFDRRSVHEGTAGRCITIALSAQAHLPLVAIGWW